MLIGYETVTCCKKEPLLIDTLLATRLLQNACHSRAFNAGWWDEYTDLGSEKQRMWWTGSKLMLCVTELAEAMEGMRKDKQDDHLPHRSMLEVELADAAIRIFDLAGGLGLDLGAAISEKLEYNASRLDHQRSERLKEGGKKI